MLKVMSNIPGFANTFGNIIDKIPGLSSIPGLPSILGGILGGLKTSYGGSISIGDAVNIIGNMMGAVRG